MYVIDYIKMELDLIARVDLYEFFYHYQLFKKLQKSIFDDILVSS